MNITDLNYLICTIGNICDVISYIHGNVLMLRIVLVIASVMFIWSAVIIPDPESIFWNVIYLLINLCHFFYLLWLMRPVEFEDEDIERVYAKLFAPPLTAMSKADFQVLCETGYLRTIPKDHNYSDDGSLVDNLSILISGKVESVRYDTDKYGKRKEKVVNTIDALEFIESPQWLTRRKDFDQTFVGHLRAAEQCRYLTWKLDELDALISARPQYKSYIDAVVGCDVAQKILKMDDSNIEALHEEAHPEPPASSDPFQLDPAVTAAYNREYGIVDQEAPVTVDQGMSNNRSLIFGGSVHRRHNAVSSRRESFNQHHHHHEEQHVHASLGRSVHLRKTIGDMLSGSVHKKAPPTAVVHHDAHSHPTQEEIQLGVLSPLRGALHHSGSYQAIAQLDPTAAGGGTDGGITEPSDHHMYVVNEDVDDNSSNDY